MKPTLLFAMLSTVFAVPHVSAMTEVELLRAKCAEQERAIRRLEDQVSTMKSGPTQTTAAAKATVPSPAPAATPAIHTVRRGECLEAIARKNGCSVLKLAKANGLKTSAMIHPGQKLKLPGSAAAQTPAMTASAPAKTAPASATHKVKAGETYASISRKYKVSAEALIAANPETKPTALRPGQTIRISTAAPAPTPASAPTSQPKPAPALAATRPAPPKSEMPAQTMTSTPVVASKPAPAPAPASAPTPAQTAPPTPASAPAAPTPAATTKAPEPASSSQESPPSPNAEKKIRSVTIEGEMTYGEFAAKHGTDAGRLNDLNGLDLTNATVLAKGSELYVPAQP